MTLITWTKDFSTDIKSIDEEHRKLIALVNDLHDAMGSGKGREIAGKVLKDLLEYTKTHFGHEEKIMTVHSYPGYLHHKKEHDELARKVEIMYQDLNAGKLVITVVIMKFLKDWLTKHIQVTDRKYVPFLLSRGVA